MEALLDSVECCTPACPDPKTVNIPGPPGGDGEDGADGANGLNAYTKLTAAFTVPPERDMEAPPPDNIPGEGTITVESTEWMVPRFGNVSGQILDIQQAGKFEVVSIISPTQARVRNNAKRLAGFYPENADPGFVAPIGARVSPSGLQGPKGDESQTAFKISRNLEEGVAPTMRTNLGLRTAALADVGNLEDQVPKVSENVGLTSGEAIFATSTGLESKTAVNARSALGLGGMALQQPSAVTITGGAIANISPPIPIASGGTNASNEDDAIKNFGVFRGYGLLGVRKDIHMETAPNDNNIDIKNAPRYQIDRIVVEGASAAITTGAISGVFTGDGGTGTRVGLPTTFTELTDALKFKDVPLDTTAPLPNTIHTASILRFRTSAANGAVSTVTVRIYGWVYPPVP